MIAIIMHRRLIGLLCLAGLEVGASQQLPYNPSYAFVSADASSVYLLGPAQDDSTFRLSSLNVTSELSAFDLSPKTISDSLPFQLQPQTAISAAKDPADTLYLLSGTCGDGAQGSGLWTYNASNADGMGRNWAQKKLDTSRIDDAASNGGLNFLGSAMTFAGGAMTRPELYLFGGLCPNSTSLTAETWQSSASYSNNMLMIQQASGQSKDRYIINEVVTRGPPIAEAGFSVTPLAAAYLNSSDSSPSSQQNFAFIGGQTSSAFINMSQVALFSLPEESWSFVPVNAPQSSSGSDPTSRSPPSIDPRAGHAAAISSDGRKVYVTGGWVGDVNTAADPQLLVLQVGDGYGGSGDWEWSIPEQQKGGPAGIFGHGAAMLPGDILMITGGYNVQDASQNKLRKRPESTASTMTYFYNTSSNAWTTTYRNPNTSNGEIGPASGPGGQDSSTKLGLGIGLGLGIPLFIVLAIFAFYRHKLRKKRQQRDHTLQQVPVASTTFQYQLPGSGGIDGRGGNIAAARAMEERTSADPYPWAPAPASAGNLGLARGSDAERTGLLYDVPSPTRGLRRSLHSRTTNYWYEDGRRSRGSGHIHPIDEEDEGNPSNNERDAQSPQNLIQLNDDIVTAAPVLDPFTDSHERSLLDGSRSPSPQSPARERQQEYRGWMNDWAAAESIRQQHSGRVSPEKSDRTSSSLSDSARSAVSALSYQPSVNRSSSQRSGALLAASVRPHGQRVSPPESPLTPTTPKDQRRAQSMNLSRRSGNESSATSGPSFSRLQVEGQALLGSTPPQPDSPTRTQNRARSWMGSVRRALTGGNQRNSIAVPERNSPEAHPSMVQRSASAGSMPWRRRQGASDWDYEGSTPGPGSSTARAPEDEDWDVESAVERRVVQVMFTVPRERLRVVNAGPAGDGASIASTEQDPLIEASDDKTEGKERENRKDEGRG